MDQSTIDIIIKVVISLLVGLITSIVIPAISSWYTNLKTNKFKVFIKSCVDAAEQIYGSGTAQTKKAYVVQKFKEVFKNKISDEMLDMYIESAVMPISAAIKQAKEVAASSASTTIVNSTADGATQVVKEYDTAKQTVNGLIVANNEKAIIPDKKDSAGNITLS